MTVEHWLGPAKAIARDCSSSLDPSNDIAMEYWDLLFDAVVERLRSTSEGLDPSIVSRRGLTLAQARDSIAECAQALDQLHLAAAHEFARCLHTDDVARPLTLGSAGILNAKNFPQVPFEVARTIWHAWHAWHDNRRAPVDGLPPV